MKNPIVSLRHVYKKYGSTIALNNVSCEIPRNSVTAIIGANGSGKTTLMRLISSLYRPTSGTITIDGLNSVKNSAAVREKIGLMLGGDVALFSQMSVQENIVFYGMMQGLSENEALIQSNKLCVELSLSQFQKIKVDTLSRGIRQKVLFAQTVIHSPEILLMDEPSTGLDIFAILDVQDLILHYANERTVIISSHNMDEIERLCNYVLLLHKGNLLFEGTKQSFIDTYSSQNVRTAFFNAVCR